MTAGIISAGMKEQMRFMMIPDSTAVRVALWRALHVELDPPPHVLEDSIGLELVAPPEDWRQWPDMGPPFSGSRFAMVARARFVEDVVIEQVERGVRQYVILGAGLDTFAQRQPEVASRMHIFEVDRPVPQAWKRQRLIELGYGVPEWLRLVPVDFEAGALWWDELLSAGFDAAQPAVVASTGVSMYITKEATAATLRKVVALPPGSTLAMTFMLPLDMIESAERPGLQAAVDGARASGTPFVSFFSPEEMLALAHKCGFREARHVSTADLNERYFNGRPERLGTSEQFLVATV